MPWLNPMRALSGGTMNGMIEFGPFSEGFNSILNMIVDRITKEIVGNVQDIIKSSNVKDIKGTEVYFTAQEAADKLNVSLSTIYRYTSKRMIEHYKPNGGAIMITQDALLNFIKKNKIKTYEEIENEASDYLNKG